MSKLTEVETRLANWRENSAICAWRRLSQDYPQRLEPLHEMSSTRVVYRLVRARKPDTDIIAKQCRLGTALIERAVYEEILPNLPLPMLRYYGAVEEPNRKFCWLFLEDVGHRKYDRRIKQHRVAAARWLGIMNTSATKIAAASRLPARTPEHYLALLRSARNTILLNIDNPALAASDLMPLKAVVAQCDHLDEHWNQLEAACEALPQTLVHGDFIGKNIAIRSTRDGITLLPFDWENAGWGIPAEDISKVDITTYWLTVRDYWPGQSMATFRRLADVGKVFRCLVFLHWLAPRLAEGSMEQTINEVRRCETWLADLIRTAGWKA